MENITTTGRKPSHRIYQVQGDGEKAIWTPIGAAWPNRHGDGFLLSYDAVPLNGRILMRPIADEAKRQGGER